MAARFLRALGKVGRTREVVRCATQIRNWPQVLRRYVGLGGGYPVRFQTRRGGVLELKNHHDLVTAWVLFCRNEYRVPPGAAVVLDLGANIGGFTLLAALRCPTARVFSIEPFPETFERLTRTVAENRLGDRVTCWRLGVWSDDSPRRMGAGGPSQSRGIVPADDDATGTVEVETISLPRLLERVVGAAGGARIDFLKIDVEGAEHEFLLGLPPGALDPVRAVGMEYHPNGSRDRLFAALSEQGLECTSDLSFGKDVGVAHFARAR